MSVYTWTILAIRCCSDGSKRVMIFVRCVMTSTAGGYLYFDWWVYKFMIFTFFFRFFLEKKNPTRCQGKLRLYCSVCSVCVCKNLAVLGVKKSAPFLFFTAVAKVETALLTENKTTRKKETSFRQFNSFLFFLSSYFICRLTQSVPTLHYV